VQLGYLMAAPFWRDVFSWPGSGFLLNTAIFQRDIPLLQDHPRAGAVFVSLNLFVDLVKPHSIRASAP